MITINRKTLIITSIVMIILLSLSIGGNVYAGAARASIESTGRLEINDPLGGGYYSTRLTRYTGQCQ